MRGEDLGYILIHKSTYSHMFGGFWFMFFMFFMFFKSPQRKFVLGPQFVA